MINLKYDCSKIKILNTTSKSYKIHYIKNEIPLQYPVDQRVDQKFDQRLAKATFLGNI